jgi:hypothetical protein
MSALRVKTGTAVFPHLFKVDPHDDQEVLGALVRVGLEELCVLDRGTDVVNRARTDDLPSRSCHSSQYAKVSCGRSIEEKADGRTGGGERTTSNRSSSPLTISSPAFRPSSTVAAAVLHSGVSHAVLCKQVSSRPATNPGGRAGSPPCATTRFHQWAVSPEVVPLAGCSHEDLRRDQGSDVLDPAVIEVVAGRRTCPS